MTGRAKRTLPDPGKSDFPRMQLQFYEYRMLPRMHYVCMFTNQWEADSVIGL
jgi:hypothetical protein